MSDQSLLLLSFVVVPLFFVLLQYYGLPLLDRLSLILWTGARQRIQATIQKRKQEYDDLVEDMVRDENLDRRDLINFVTERYNFLACFVGYGLCYLMSLAQEILAAVTEQWNSTLVVNGYCFCAALFAWRLIQNRLTYKRQKMAYCEAKKRTERCPKDCRRTEQDKPTHRQEELLD
jgi:hypothetical protein